MDNTPASSRTPNGLLHDLEDLVAEAQALLVDAAAGQSGDAIRALQARFDAARARIGQLYTGARDKVVAGARCTDNAIRANPYQSLAIAIGAGVLVGVLLARRHR